VLNPSKYAGLWIRLGSKYSWLERPPPAFTAELLQPPPPTASSSRSLDFVEVGRRCCRPSVAVEKLRPTCCVATGCGGAVATVRGVEYQALYRKYRPQLFGDVVGQDHVTETLRREVAEGKVAHAYLFAGPRGTGKTTSARILAKALNCVDRTEAGEPCNVCDSCVAVTAGTSMDVIELDAASHNKVEDVRDIRVSVSTVASVGGAKRIFILDEAHMLTKAAGNALLKTLEEPPEHVHFVLATTEPYKLLDTIRSRSQRFDFQPLSLEVLSTHLEKISQLEGFDVEPGSLLAVARHARGSARDALSLLEQVAALGSGSVNDAGVRRALGLAGRDAYVRIANAMAANDASDGLKLVAELAGGGVDLRQFVGDAIGFFRGVFLTQYGKDIESVVDEPPDVIEDWATVGGLLEPAQVLRVVDLLSEALLKLREGREERLMLELSILKLTRPEVSDDPAALSARIAKLEQSGLARGPQADPTKSPQQPAVKVSSEENPKSAELDIEPQVTINPTAEPVEIEVLESDEPTTIEVADVPSQPDADDPSPAAVPTSADLNRIWPQLVAAVRELGARREAVFRESSPDGVEGSTVVLTVPAHLEFHLEQLTSDKELRSFVTDRASALLGSLVEVEFRIVGEGTAPPAHPVTAEADVEELIPDKDSLLEAPDSGTDPVSLLAAELGAEVVDDPDADPTG